MAHLSVVILLSVFCGFTNCFWRRRYHSSILAGNWIYIDGGDIMDEQRKYFPNNDTYGLDLSRNWFNSSLVLTRTQRPANAIPLNGQALWFDEKQNLIYCFGGFKSFAVDSLDPAPFESIWAFTPDGQGSGNWKEVLGPMGIQAFPSNILRPSDGGFCNDESSGYYIGGYVSSASTRSMGRGEASNGLLTFRFNDLHFTNTSDGNYERSLDRNIIFGSGKMVNIPKFGTGGIIILLGEGNPTQVISFNNITIYDKAKLKWYSQPASGALPEPRSDFCIVGIPGTTASNSFEIFMYGGIINYELGPRTPNSDQVYILSLPAFQWFKATYPPRFSRALHTCHTTKTNQMIIIGGVDPSNDTIFSGSADSGNEPMDPWPEGIGIFDMTALKFKDSYEANAKQYETPELIKRFYNDRSNQYPATWNSLAVKELFQTQSNRTLNVSNSETPVPSNSSTATQSQNPRHSPSPHLSSVLIAEIVIGAILFVTLFVAGAIFIVRKKRTNKNAKRSNPEIFKVKLSVEEEHHHRLPAPAPAPAELPGLTNNNKYGQLAELPNTGIIELSDGSNPSCLNSEKNGQENGVAWARS